jgi:hypothetical protein
MIDELTDRVRLRHSCGHEAHTECGGEKAGGPAASVVGEWRGVRATAQ